MCVCVVLFFRSEAEGRMLEVGEWIEVETAHFTKRRMQLKTIIDHDVKLQTFMETKFQEVICFEENDDSKNRSMILACMYLVPERHVRKKSVSLWSVFSLLI